MHFIETIEIEEWFVERGVEPNAHSEDDVVVLRRYFGQAVNPLGQERDVAALAAAALGEWDECLLWVTLWGIWGSSEDWPTYYAARGTMGEKRSLEQAPGHVFERQDRAAFEEFLRLVMENAWDASVVPVNDGKSTGRRMKVSHDEFVEVLSSADSAPNS